MNPPISAVIIAFNEGHQIERALRSVAWCDEIVVVDSQSTDDTVDICRSFGARVITQPFLGYGPQLQFAEMQCSHNWLLRLDADETISPELAREIREEFEHGPRGSGYKMPRRNYWHKRWISSCGLYPSRHLRLYRRDKGGYTPSRIHEKVRVEGRVRHLRGAIDHWAWERDGDIAHDFVNYAQVEARSMTENGERVLLPQLLLWPFWNFMKRFVFRGGFRHGALGAAVCARIAAQHALRLVLAWEMQNRAILERADATWEEAQPRFPKAREALDRR